MITTIIVAISISAAIGSNSSATTTATYPAATGHASAPEAASHRPPAIPFSSASSFVFSPHRNPSDIFTAFSGTVLPVKGLAMNSGVRLRPVTCARGS